jgi:hypothetical protein
MNETLEAIRAEWRGGGLARCLAGEDYTPPNACDEQGRIIKWQYVIASWTVREDAVIRTRYYKHGILGCLDGCPTRTKDQIRCRAQVLGVQAVGRGKRRRT